MKVRTRLPRRDDKKRCITAETDMKCELPTEGGPCTTWSFFQGGCVKKLQHINI